MPLNILCVSGSLRKGSILTGIVRYAIQSAPKTVNFEFLDLHGVPLYDGDIDPTEKRGPAKVWPPSVANLRSKVIAADAILIGLSENNFNISAAMANFLSWASRSEEVDKNGAKITISPIIGKKVGVISGGGGYGGAKAQAALRAMDFLKLEFIDLPEGLTTFNVFEGGKVDMGTGDVVDEGMKEKIRKFVVNFVEVAGKK